ncbi:MAG: transposase [FCB group bacterium]|nr:transposase [FCB group bacterium]
MGRDRYKIVDSSYPYHITCTIRNWHPIFMDPDVVTIIISSLKFLQKEDLILYAYVIMENHLHLIVKSDNLSEKVKRFKSFTATEIVNYYSSTLKTKHLKKFKYINKLTHSKHKIWEEGFHPVMIENPETMSVKLKYVHENPVRRGYVDEAESWKYSSARNYSGQKGLIDVVTEWW